MYVAAKTPKEEREKHQQGKIIEDNITTLSYSRTNTNESQTVDTTAKERTTTVYRAI